MLTQAIDQWIPGPRESTQGDSEDCILEQGGLLGEGKPSPLLLLGKHH